MRAARTEWTDWYADATEAAVLVDGQVLVLSPLASVLVAALASPAELSELAGTLVEHFGEPDGDLLEVTTTVVEDLVTSGVLRWVDGDVS